MHAIRYTNTFPLSLSNSISEYYNDDGHSLHPEHIHEFLARVMYERRTKNDPLWNYLVVGGVKNGKS